MKIGLIDVDGHSNFPNIPLMKIAAWHKQQGDEVEWYQPLFSGHMDRVYMSKVFSFSPQYPYYVDATEVIKGGSGYHIRVEDGKEIYDKENERELPPEIEHIYPDYSIYGITDTAYGFLTRGCPRGCSFCHTGVKDGRVSRKVADLKEFWNGQKKLVLLDQNLLAAREWKDLLQQIIDSKASVEFNGGLDIRLMTQQKAAMVKQVKTKVVHFAWDRYQDKEIIVPQLKQFKEVSGWDKRKMVVYVLCNYDTTTDQDLERIYTLKELGYWPYVTVYNKEALPKNHITRNIQRWVNMRAVFETVPTFEEYLQKRKAGR